eukprot:m.199786 g.199786  ORF g.199786 m.199786 type:complete len:395 (-) comp53806_c0_seq7:819-2003(-)
MSASYDVDEDFTLVEGPEPPVLPATDERKPRLKLYACDSRSQIATQPAVGVWADRLLATLNNVVHSQIIKPSFPPSPPIFITGTCFQELAGASSARVGPSGLPAHVVAALTMVKSFVWVTYRYGFASFPNSTLCSDRGWGCILRSAQMMAARALTLRVLGKSWRVTSPDSLQQAQIRDIIRLVADDPTEQSPLSVHHLLSAAESEGYRPGQWFSPSVTCRLIAHLLGGRQGSLLTFPAIPVLVAQDGLISKSKILALAANQGALPWTPILVLIPTRLGLADVSSVYFPLIKAFLELNSCLGIVGGRPHSSLYFIGYQGDHLIGLDPHTCQRKADTTTASFSTQTYHTENCRKIPLVDVDPSMALALYLETENDLLELELFRQQGGRTPLFSIGE